MAEYHYIIVGSGIAGLYTALLARQTGEVLILTKGSIDECNTKYAQGGIAAAVGADDSPALHVEDTLRAGAGLSEEHPVRILAEEAADRISDLITFGVRFDTVEGEIALAREAAHSTSRILHAGGDATGEHIELSLSTLARMSEITILEHSLVTQILVEGGRAFGVRVLDTQLHTSQDYEGRFIILATGGAGQLFRYTTNPSVATADGVALAYHAGAELRDMEFFQFHPTALRLPGAPPFLISEAVRGEGGILRNVEGRAFMRDYAPEAELAPRDVVSRSLLREMQKTGTDHVYLDVSHLPPSRVTARFPQIYRFCREHGLDITREPIPVAPAAHYMMGGVKTNTWGETNIAGLYACGEVASTGVHGANRLASNSLLEVLIFGKRTIEATQEVGRNGPVTTRAAPERECVALEEACAASSETTPPTLSALQELMWDKVGMVRDHEGLAQAKAQLAAWQSAYAPGDDRASQELANLITAARLMTEAALMREESRGAHYRSDFPEPREEWQRHIVFRQRQ